MVVRTGKNGKFYGCPGYPQCKSTAPYKEVRTPQVRVQRDWSEFQLDIFDAVGRSEDNLIVEAVAGASKTTVGVESLYYATRYQKIAFVAFNRSIAQDFKTRVPEGVHASTYHALGLKSIMQARGNEVKVEETKNFKLFNQFTDSLAEAFKSTATDYRSEILRLVGLAKNVMLDVTGTESFRNLADEYGIDIGDDNESGLVLDLTYKVYKASVEDNATIDFDDMIHWCATGRVEPLAFDFVVNDESQDANPARIAMLLRMLRNGGRSMVVGDRKQAIYQWAGSSEGAMDIIKHATNARELPLSITYRCPASHVKLAQELVPQIQARPNAPEGIIGYLKPWQLTNFLRDGDMVMCRTNAPLVRPAFEMLAQGKKAIIVGRDIGSNMVNLIDRIAKKNSISDTNAMLDELTKYIDMQVYRLEKTGKLGKAAMLRDQLETIEAIADGCPTVGSVNRKITDIFSDDKVGVRFASVHRSKGLEAERTVILRPELMPHPMAQGDQAMESEFNVKYVSLTRSKSEMYFVE
jgi:superfamily I DNA/RNA helicase